MTYACEFSDQNNEKFYSMGTRDKGSDTDRSLGRMKIIEGTGFGNNTQEKFVFMDLSM